MVGGSVSGRPFKADPTSYEETRIPCGAPARYRSRGVIRLNTGDVEPYEDQRMGVPGKGTQSEAEEHLKRMVQNQLDTKVSLESQLHASKRKEFTKATTYKPFCPEETSGALSLKDYQSLEEQDQRIEKLRQYGLTDDEIQFKLEEEGYISKAPKRSCYGVNPYAYHEKLRELETRIQEKDRNLSMPDTFSNVRVVSRHAMEVERSLNRGTDKANSLSHLVQVDYTGETKRDAYEWTITRELNRKPTAKVSLSTLTCPNAAAKILEESQEEKIKQSSEMSTNTPNESPTVVCTKEEEPIKSDKVRLPQNLQPIPEEEILKNKLSLEAIRDIPRFKDYQPGKPSKTLYLKNLNPKVSEADLVALFIKFQHKDGPKIVFRLMKGRMKGQAFVTLPDVATASAALELVNGYQLLGKPVIIQFGRQKENSELDDTAKIQTEGK